MRLPFVIGIVILYLTFSIIEVYRNYENFKKIIELKTFVI